MGGVQREPPVVDSILQHPARATCSSGAPAGGARTATQVEAHLASAAVRSWTPDQATALPRLSAWQQPPHRPDGSGKSRDGTQWNGGANLHHPVLPRHIFSVPHSQLSLSRHTPPPSPNTHTLTHSRNPRNPFQVLWPTCLQHPLPLQARPKTPAMCKTFAPSLPAASPLP